MFLKNWGFWHSKRTSSCGYKSIIEELCHHFSLADIRKSTNNFDLKRLIDGEGFGIEAYEGCLQHDGSDYTVTIRRFKEEKLYRDTIVHKYTRFEERHQILELFKNEIELLCQLRHPNIVSLVGFCNHKKEKIIVYDYMPNGSLHQHIESGKLSWKKRVEICIGAARGLHYLHAGAKRTIIHRDIHPRNILLDANMEPKLSNFGISVQGQRFMSKPKPIKVDHAAGTFGYMAKEHFVDLTITDKTDVYSFGMVLFDVVCGGKYIEIEQGYEPVEDIIDLNIKRNIAPECWRVFVDIMEKCLKHDPDERPTMGEVEVQLEHALSLQEQADIVNTNGDYTLLSKTIINPLSSRASEYSLRSEHSLRSEYALSEEYITEDSDLEDLLR